MSVPTQLKLISPSDFADFGYNDVAYVKPIETDGLVSYAAHAADGSFLWQFDDRNSALAMLHRHELVPVSLH